MQNDQLKISGATSGATLFKISQQPSNESLKVLTGVPFSSQPGSKKIIDISEFAVWFPQHTLLKMRGAKNTYKS